MGEVVSLAAARARRGHATPGPDTLAPQHPSLRWIAGDVWYLAHRRTRHGGAACGMPGGLILAPPGVPLCTDCYPAARDAAR